MPLIPRYPFWDLERWFEDEGSEDLLPKLFRQGVVRAPRMDVYETNGEVVAEAELPGVNPKDIEVEVKDNILRIEAKGEEKKEDKKKGYYRKETSSRYYKRACPLPLEVLGDKADASYEGGILKVTIPKAKPKKKEEKKGHKVKVKTT